MDDLNVEATTTVESTNTGVDSSVAPDNTSTDAKGADKDDSKAFSIRLSQEKAKIEKAYDPFKTLVANQAKMAGMTVEEYTEFALSQQQEEILETEAEKAGKSPEVYKAEKAAAEAQARLQEYERKEQLSSEEKEMIADEKIGTFVSENLDQIRQIALDTGTDLKVGLALIAAEKLPELLAAADPEVHIKNYLASVRKGEKPIEIGNGPDVPGGKPLKTMEDAFASARERLTKRS